MKKKIYYLDVLRVIACLMVIMIHASGYYVTKNIGSTNFWISNVLDSLVRVAVPIFVMISGALLLDKNYKYSKDKLVSHIYKMILMFVVWSLMYTLLFDVIEPIILKHESISVFKTIINFVKGYYHLWFFYLIVGLYLILPLLRLWVKDENKKYVEYFLILSIIFTFIISWGLTIGSYYSDNIVKISEFFNNKFQLKYISGYTSYFILGWYLNNYKVNNKNRIYLLSVVSILLSIFGIYILSITLDKPVQLYDYLGINVLIPSIALFIYVKDKYNKKKESNIISSISKYSLGIYVIHAGVLKVMYKLLESLGFNNAIPNILIVFIISFGVSYLITSIISKIPKLNNIV